jgi:3',5'-cyclic AMP phosphodiesterase CpdA
MLLCQISDPHVVAEGQLAYGRIDTPAMLERCIRKVCTLPRLPDAVVLTGDLVDHGSGEEYGVLRELLSPLPMPFYLVIGNHDDRIAVRRAFPRIVDFAGADGFVQYVVDEFPLRLVVLDTVIPRAPGGELCRQRLEWLDRVLSGGERPTVIAQHHPPFATGMTVMDRMSLRNPDDEAAVLSRHVQIERVISGHFHRTIHARFAGTIASVCPSTAHQLMLNLMPDADIRFAFEPSGFQLHLWDGERLVTHSELVEDFPSWGSRG